MEQWNNIEVRVSGSEPEITEIHRRITKCEYQKLRIEYAENLCYDKIELCGMLFGSGRAGNFCL